MKRRKSLFMHLSNIRLLAKKFALVLLFLSAFVLMLVNKTDTAIIEKTSSLATDVVSPVIDILVIPARAVADVYDYLKELKQIHQENQTESLFFHTDNISYQEPTDIKKHHYMQYQILL